MNLLRLFRLPRIDNDAQQSERDVSIDLRAARMHRDDAERDSKPKDNWSEEDLLDDI